MENDITVEDKLFILNSKIKFHNEQIFNHEVEIEAWMAEPGYDPNNEGEHLTRIREYLANAIARKAVFEAKINELL
jgi:hypothetical protein